MQWGVVTPQCGAILFLSQRKPLQLNCAQLLQGNVLAELIITTFALLWPKTLLLLHSAKEEAPAEREQTPPALVNSYFFMLNTKGSFLVDVDISSDFSAQTTLVNISAKVYLFYMGERRYPYKTFLRKRFIWEEEARKMVVFARVGKDSQQLNWQGELYRAF